MTPRVMTLICEDCGEVLTSDEREFYGSRCEDCERMAWETLQRWKAGEHNPTLDQRYNDKPTVH